MRASPLCARPLQEVRSGLEPHFVEEYDQVFALAFPDLPV